MLNLTTILLIITLAASGLSFFGIKGCLAERDARIAAQEDNKRLQALNQKILEVAGEQKEVREKYEQEKNRLDGLSGLELDAEWERMFPGTAAGGADKPKAPGPQ